MLVGVACSELLGREEIILMEGVSSIEAHGISGHDDVGHEAVSRDHATGHWHPGSGIGGGLKNKISACDLRSDGGNDLEVSIAQCGNVE